VDTYGLTSTCIDKEITMKYKVYGIMTASVLIGEYEAKTAEDALDMANDDTEADWYPSLCHQCAREIDMGDIYDTECGETSW
jgi:hypothetical protein